mmetsp:Transcript_14187/g.47902  ORF Transcript_14187/g.47902 Transcript_14187/m.47902 type:complete len:499 (-) Transcript_14187:41-1537(-)|eukprot:CAMPEP_0198429422 /NCGR_PEP_ID=MMETSP1452-20131203/7473_1 /TAXON_ID=1181717 /ORGANISM="Synchroma pusillum, Strain CCMP3072" /LENGTH=498 /DNA_ID=CAMNT_0044149829 /DNA_START=47 /DNA_END=1543 /DNA_ORIENTATION=+
MASSISVSDIMERRDPLAKRTKIICTLGPSCWDVDTLGDLIDNGMNVARLNFSHGDHETHAGTLERLREACAARRHKNVAVMLDTKGPEIRTGKLEGGDKVTYVKDSIVEVVTDYAALGNPGVIACSYSALATSVKVGSTILIADGSLALEVTELLETSVRCRVMNNATIGERKNMNLPGIKVELPVLTEKDINDLQAFGVVHGVDYIAASFVQSAADVRFIREVLGDAGAHIKIICKIENYEGVQNFDEILDVTDGVMVARGDLGMEIPPEKVFLAQKMMIHKCNVRGKPVVTATQMLESMIKAPRPTRAECTDVANAVLDGSDCVMLSGETAGGEYPLQAVQMMAAVCTEAEAMLDYNELFVAMRRATQETSLGMTAAESVASSAVKTAMDVGAKLIVVLSETGTTPRLVAKYRPAMPILVVTAVHEVARQCEGFLKNTTCRVIESMIGTENILVRGVEFGRALGWVSSGDSVVLVHGMKEAQAGSTNSLRVVVAP